MKPNETIDAAEIQTVHRRIANLEQQVARQRKSITDLVEREENYRAIFDAANEAMVILDRRSGKIVDFTASAVELYGTDGKHFRDLDAGELFGGESPAAGRNAVQTDYRIDVGIQKRFEAGEEWALDELVRFTAEINLRLHF